MCAPAARHSWRGNTSPPERRALTASSALATCMPRSARPAANQSQARRRDFVLLDNIDLCRHTFDIGLNAKIGITPMSAVNYFNSISVTKK